MPLLPALLLASCAGGGHSDGAGVTFREEQVTCPAPRPLGASFYWPATGAVALPTAVILVGAQPWNRYGDLPSKPWGHYRDIAEGLARNGAAALLFDKGGTGQTGGPSPDLAGRVKEAEAAVACARARPEVGRIALVGHSQGAAVAVSAAATAAPDRLVLLSPPAGLPPASIPAIIIQPQSEETPQLHPIVIPGVNHLLLTEPAQAGVSHVSPAAIDAIVAAVTK